MADHFSTASSMLPNLEPILGVSFALCLAYIGLPRFRYRQKIKEYVADQMGDLKDADADIKDMSIYKSVARLSTISLTDRRLFRRSNKNGELHGVWSFIYKYLFECNQDRILVFIGALVSAVLLIFGVCHDTHAMNLAHSWFTYNKIGYWIFFVVVLQILPVFLVGCGWFMTGGAKKFAANKIEDIKKAEAAKASTAQKPKKKEAKAS